MACSCPSSNVGSGHVEPAVPKLVAELSPGLTLKASIDLIILAAVDRRGVLSDLLITFTRERRSQLMEAIEIVWMLDVPRRADDFLQKIQIAFAWRN